jgi:uncharacterized protein Yka (UPF0111/DUF47 family)
MIYLKILTSSLFLFIIIPPAHAEIDNLPPHFDLIDFLITVFQNITEQFNIAEDERADLQKQIDKNEKEIDKLKKEIKKLKKK